MASEGEDVGADGAVAIDPPLDESVDDPSEHPVADDGASNDEPVTHEDTAEDIETETATETDDRAWSLTVWRWRFGPASLTLIGAMAVFFAVFGRLMWLRHARYGTFDFDLGHHDQAIWLLSQGKGFITVSGMPVLGHHLTLAYFAVVPLYWLGGGPQLLDLLQTAAMALAAVPIYVYAKHRLGNEWWAVGFGVAWLLNPSVQWLVWEAWHPETMAIPFFLAAYVLSEKGRMRGYWIFLLITLAWKEDLALAVLVLGGIYALRGRRRLGLTTIAVGAAWFVLAYMIVMPHFNGGQNHAGIFYGEIGDGPLGIIRTTLTDPGLIWQRLEGNDAFGYGRDLLAPFGFTPLLAPLTLLMAVPQYFANALTNQSFFYDIRFHYVAIILAVMALASVEGVARLRGDGLRRFGVGVVVAAALATTVAWGRSPISTQYRDGYWALNPNPLQEVLDDAVDRVPDGASVAATYNIVPHLSHREQIYTFPNPWIPSNWGVAGIAPDDPNHDHVPSEVDWLVINVGTHQPGSQVDTLFDTLIDDGEFEVVSNEQNIIVAERVAPPGGS